MRRVKQKNKSITGASLSTFEEDMLNPSFKARFDKGYKEFLFSELLIALMLEETKSVRKLAAEIGISPSVIQDMRSGKRKNLTLKNFMAILEALGCELLVKTRESIIRIKDTA